jgi:hypothetical protein
MSLDVYAESERIVAALTDEQCDAVMAALERRVDRWELAHPRTATNIIGAIHGKPPIPARRKVGLLEAIRGVECCDPAVRASWRLWRLCGAVVCVIVGASLIAGTLVGAPGVGLVLGVAATMSMSVAFSMMRGSATVCH